LLTELKKKKIVNLSGASTILFGIVQK
jgi:hypothetical protein